MNWKQCHGLHSHKAIAEENIEAQPLCVLCIVDIAVHSRPPEEASTHMSSVLLETK